jgi:small-conductance mechanosensitive channel
MMRFFELYTKELFATGLVFITVILLRVIVSKAIRKYSKSHTGIEKRTNLVIKYIHLLINILATISLIATVVGVAMFAQWSILSNITSGVILFFSFPFKIGDVIKVHDKDFPFEGEIIDINAFHTDLITKEGERLVYPNNLLLQKGISIVKPRFEDQEFTD